ncbi:cation:proton antiporter domain-containing protein [Nakamurella endophytica]|uniref:Cation/H+ exchanger transmembrane domain-containing protein n=1 Tax=Nakamurella endophytica TaxID=1748367 RepID=A0A917WCZ8_9ACTN|nr:cation:proton antiporter [Nakamurella endophytica]GGL92968.1 hypothetical protein GCM10011594_10980 [Nakamurella endophytica]
MVRLHVVLAVVGVAGLVLALFSGSIRRLPLSEPLVVLVLGVVLGPYVLGVLDLSDGTRTEVLLEGSRVLLAWSVTAAALRFPVRPLRGVLRPVGLLLVVAMPLAAVSTGAAALVTGVPLALAAVVGACLSPTDPVLAASVVTGGPAEHNLPGRLRQVITVESGANDGLALPLVVLALAWAGPGETFGAAVRELLWQVLAGSAIGALLGLGTGWALRVVSRRRDLEHGPQLVLTLLMAIAVLGVCRLANTDGVLGAFVAGLAYNALVERSERQPEQGIDEAVNRYAVLPLFLVLGAVLPLRDWVALGPGVVLFAVAVLLVRRLPFVLALARPLGLSVRDATFAGWFGPVGVSAIFYLAHSAEQGITDPRVFALGSLAVALSVVAFGVSSVPLRNLYARSRTDGAAPGASGAGRRAS